TNGVAFDDGPLLTIDPVTPANGRVFVFTRSGNPGGGIVEGQVTQAAETLASASKVVATLTNSKNGPAAFVGAFNDSYFTGSGTRLLYLCGSGPGQAQTSVLYTIGFTSPGFPTMNTSVSAGLTLSSGTSINCSPLTEFKNGATDSLFVSVANNCGMGSSPPAAGCIGAVDIA